MAASDVSICSNALLMLGASPINDFSENFDRARLASNLYPLTRDSILRAHPWNCAVKRVALAPEVTAPPFDWQFMFPLPADFLRVLSVGEAGVEVDYKIESGKLLCDDNPALLRYVWRNETPATWDSMLVECMQLAMAARMAYAITQSASLEQARFGELQMALKRARAVDGQDEPPQTLGDFPLLASRRGGRPWG